jgi:ribosome recycling factor
LSTCRSISARRTSATLRTGRAHPSLLDHVTVEYYGSRVPISQVANIGIGDARTLTVTAWEKPMVAAVDKAIRSSDLGLNPVTAGTVIRVPLPVLTEERRRDLVRVVRKEGENGKIAVRNIRRDAMNDLKELEKEKEISEDDERRGGELIQKQTDKYVAEVEALLAAKEAELMEI